jgi:hypothetical protein
MRLKLEVATAEVATAKDASDYTADVLIANSAPFSLSPASQHPCHIALSDAG